MHGGAGSDAFEWVGLRPARVVVGQAPSGSDPAMLHGRLLLFAPDLGAWHNLDGWICNAELPSGQDLLFFNGIEGGSPTYLTFHNSFAMHATGQRAGSAPEADSEHRPEFFDLLPKPSRQHQPGLVRLQTRLEADPVVDTGT